MIFLLYLYKTTYLHNKIYFIVVPLCKTGRSTKVTNEDPVIACVGDRTHHLIENLDPATVCIFFYRFTLSLHTAG